MSRRSLPRLGAGLVVAAATAAAVGGASCGSSPLTCPAGQTACGSVCTDLETDSGNCGRCNTTCYPGATCQAGACQCPTGQTFCLGACANLATDPKNCGTCGHACGLGTCGTVAGGAGCVCNSSPSTVTLCPPANPATGTCVDTATSTGNCGSCSFSCTTNSGSGFTCAKGSCTCGSPNSVCPGATSGALPVCTNTATDPKNCGTCGNACQSAQTCSGSACLCPAATPSLCGSACTNLLTDPKNCGTCGNVCPSTQVCSAGSCTLSCPSNEFACAGNCCAGGCCGSGSQATCQFQHNNGAGQNFFDCIALGDYTVQLATDAATAWAPTGSQVLPPPYADCVSWLSSASAGAVACGVWCYGTGSGNSPGSVYVNQGGMACISPVAFGSISTWQ